MMYYLIPVVITAVLIGGLLIMSKKGNDNKNIKAKNQKNKNIKPIEAKIQKNKIIIDEIYHPFKIIYKKDEDKYKYYITIDSEESPLVGDDGNRFQYKDRIYWSNRKILNQLKENAKNEAENPEESTSQSSNRLNDRIKSLRSDIERISKSEEYKKGKLLIKILPYLIPIVACKDNSDIQEKTDFLYSRFSELYRIVKNNQISDIISDYGYSGSFLNNDFFNGDIKRYESICNQYPQIAECGAFLDKLWSDIDALRNMFFTNLDGEKCKEIGSKIYNLFNGTSITVNGTEYVFSWVNNHENFEFSIRSNFIHSFEYPALYLLSQEITKECFSSNDKGLYPNQEGFKIEPLAYGGDNA